MKALKIIIIIAALLFGGFFAIGIFKPTVEYGVTVEVSKSPQHSWDVYTNPETLGEWLEGFSSIKTIEDAGQEVGSVYEVEVHAQGEKHVFIEKMTAFDEPRLFGMNISNEMISTDIAVTFEPTESGGTTITSKASATGANWFAKSLFALMASTFNDQEQRNYDALAELIERTEVEIEEIPTMDLAVDSLAIDSLAVDSAIAN